MKTRAAFTMIELIFVIVVMGIIGKFGVEFLAQAYKSFIFSNINNSLQSKSASTVEFIASRLQYRIKDSVIARDTTAGTFTGIGGATGENYDVLEWIGWDIDGFRGTTTPNWSGIMDLAHTNANTLTLVSPETNTTSIQNLINILSYTDSGIDDAALYFIGSNSDVLTYYGWDGNLTTVNLQRGAIHPIKDKPAKLEQFIPSVGNLTGVDVYEYYQLAWTAYAISYTAGANNMGKLTLHYDYQPWNGDTYLLKQDGSVTKSAVIMEDVSTFQFMSIGSIMKIQVCVKTDLTKSEDEYSLCKEKTIF